MDKFSLATGIALGLAGAAVGTAGIGRGLCLTAAGAAEFIEFVQPSDIACTRWRDADFGPPPGCDHGPQPHSRDISVTALSTGGVTPVMEGRHLTGSWHVFEAEYFRLSDYAEAEKRRLFYDNNPMPPTTKV